MPFEDLDKRIKELVEQRSPAYDEQSWQGMEKLLDKHLPQEKNKRRGLLIFLFSVLILGSVAVFLMYKNYSADKKPEIPQKSTTTESAKTNENLSKVQSQNNTKEVIYTDQLKEEKANSNQEIQNKISAPKLSKSNPIAQKTNNTQNKNTTNQQSLTNSEKTNTLTKNAFADTEKPIQPTANNKTNVNTQTAILNPDIKTESVNTNSLEIKTSPLKENVTSETKPEPMKASSKNNKSFLSNFVFSISGGPDVSKVGQSGTGEVKFIYGAGLGYRISKRFSIHSGFYAGRKVYTASPEDYNPPTNFWTYYPNLDHVDADCKVFDVPLNIYYDIHISKKQNWFVSAGLSSIFMKKEVYNYYYKPINSPQYIYYSRTYENKNKHYFSMLNLSGGYSRRINSTISVKAEPYAKIALTGIGYGKVKLNSGGILFSAVIQPFK